MLAVRPLLLSVITAKSTCIKQSDGKEDKLITSVEIKTHFDDQNEISFKFLFVRVLSILEINILEAMHPGEGREAVSLLGRDL